MQLSFVIPVRNDRVRLERCLRSVKAACGGRANVEVLVVDHSSDDGSGEVARHLGARVIREAAGPVSRLRNVGAAAARGELLAFVDADHEVGTQWVEAAVDAFQDSAVGGAGRAYSAPTGANWVQRGYALLREPVTRRQQVEWLGSGNLAVRRTAFQAVGGFDEALEACEDVDLCLRLRRAGWALVADPGMTSMHLGYSPTLGRVFRAELWRGRDNLRVSFRQPISWKGLVTAIIPVAQLLCAVGLVLAVLASSRIGWYAAGAFALVTLAPSVVRASRNVLRAGRISAETMFGHMCVLMAYDAGRASALLARAPHHREKKAAG